MKKTWVKRENIYYKPFYKSRFKMFLLFIFLLGIIFLIYQALSINQLPSASTPWSLENTLQGLREKHRIIVNAFTTAEQQADVNDPHHDIKIIRGIRLFDYDSYKPNFEGKFKCLDGSAEIPFERVNDDYCDCLKDGSDEPSTNACPIGRFYCKYQKRHITGRGQDVFVESSRINDGICDCCDGSDEWSAKVRTDCKNKCT